MTDAEFLDEMARKSNVFSIEAGVRMTPDERERLVALARKAIEYAEQHRLACAQRDFLERKNVQLRAEIAAATERAETSLNVAIADGMPRNAGQVQCWIDGLRAQLAERDEELRLLREAASEYIAAHATMQSRFQSAEYAQRYEDAARALYRCLADPRTRREEKP